MAETWKRNAVDCLTSKQHVSQWQISDNCMCFHTEIEVTDQNCYFTHSVLTSGHSVHVLTLYSQAGRVATGVPVFKSLVWLALEKYPKGRRGSNKGLPLSRTSGLPLSRTVCRSPGLQVCGRSPGLQVCGRSPGLQVCGRSPGLQVCGRSPGLQVCGRSPGLQVCGRSPGLQVCGHSPGLQVCHCSPGLQVCHCSPGLQVCHCSPGLQVCHCSPGLQVCYCSPGLQVCYCSPGLQVCCSPGLLTTNQWGSLREITLHARKCPVYLGATN